MITSLFKGFTMLGSEWVMWVLVALSVISFAIIFERWRGLRNQERLGAKLWKDHVDKWMSSGKSNEVQTQLKAVSSAYPCLEGKLLEVISSQEGKGREEMELVAQSLLSREKLNLEKNLSFLGTVGSNAPFIGLFGTVLGIIKAFHDLGGNMESAGAQTISSGISEALVATAIGLLVAIPAVIGYNYFQRKIKTILGRADSLSTYLMSLKD